jgi:hypothetical protein
MHSLFPLPAGALQLLVHRSPYSIASLRNRQEAVARTSKLPAGLESILLQQIDVELRARK